MPAAKGKSLRLVPRRRSTNLFKKGVPIIKRHFTCKICKKNFDKLQQLDQVVILLDEVEEFCMDRSNPALSMESRMLTTAMLTKLADLRAARQHDYKIISAFGRPPRQEERAASTNTPPRTSLTVRARPVVSGAG